MQTFLLNVAILLIFANTAREETLRLNHIGQPVWAGVSGIWAGLLFAGAVLYFGIRLPHLNRHPSS